MPYYPVLPQVHPHAAADNADRHNPVVMHCGDGDGRWQCCSDGDRSAARAKLAAGCESVTAGELAAVAGQPARCAASRDNCAAVLRELDVQLRLHTGVELVWWLVHDQHHLSLAKKKSWQITSQAEDCARISS